MLLRLASGTLIRTIHAVRTHSAVLIVPLLTIYRPSRPYHHHHHNINKHLLKRPRADVVSRHVHGMPVSAQWDGSGPCLLQCGKVGLYRAVAGGGGTFGLKQNLIGGGLLSPPFDYCPYYQFRPWKAFSYVNIVDHVYV